MRLRESLASPHRCGHQVQQQRVPGAESRRLFQFPGRRIGRTGPLAEDGPRRRWAERDQLLHDCQLLCSQLLARPHCLRRPGPGGDQHRHRQ